MTERGPRAPADNNVQDVISAIDNYTCGPIRALAQDPPQNSSDARRSGQTVHITYEVLKRETPSGDIVRLLTITDSGTSGLDGPILSASDLAERERNQGELVIQQGENWSAWEAMRYTKSGEDSLGSRGQGKYAYLYHSAHPAPGAAPDLPRHAWRMVILYDTLLPNGEYRLGIRYHNPSTQVIEPPFLDDEAREVVATSYEDEFFTIPLGLPPLTEPGTRVIIPFLSDEAVEAAANGELVHWLEAEWWRKIQKNELMIALASEDGLSQSIGVPGFWAGEPWAHSNPAYFVREAVPLPSDRPAARRLLKRVVLFADDTLENSDLEGHSQFNGVQLLRGGQWIVTLEMSEFSDAVPREYRSGFRGFVEFDRQLEHELRKVENPAHDGFNKRTGVYREIARAVRELVDEFARERGWAEPEGPLPEPQFDELVRELADLFVEPPPGPEPGEVAWWCEVEGTYPGATAVVAWGDRVGIAATCLRRPAGDGADVEFQAELVRPDGSRIDVFSPRSQVLRGRGPDQSGAATQFGDLEVRHPGGSPQSLFTTPGRYSVSVRCAVNGQAVATGRCSFYVASSPPPPPPRAVTLQLTACNPTDGSRTVPQGGQLRCEAVVRNYGTTPIEGQLAITIEATPHVLSREALQLPAALVGDQPRAFRTDPIVRTVSADGGEQSDLIALSDGTYRVLASVEGDGELLATASATIIVGHNENEGDLPFLVEEVPNDPTAPRWKLEDPGITRDHYTLRWSSGDHVFRAVRTLGRAVGDSIRLPVEDYLAVIVAEGLVEWAVRDYQAQGDEGRLRLVSAGAAASDPELGERFEERVEQLKSAIEDPQQYGVLQRELASMMIEAARRARG